MPYDWDKKACFVLFLNLERQVRYDVRMFVSGLTLKTGLHEWLETVNHKISYETNFFKVDGTMSFKYKPILSCCILKSIYIQ